MQIRLVSTSKKRFLPLLLLADEQESMIDRYLERGDLYVMYDNTVPDFFTLHYDHPIVEDGKVLKDMYYFSRTLTQTNETDG